MKVLFSHSSHEKGTREGQYRVKLVLYVTYVKIQ